MIWCYKGVVPNNLYDVLITSSHLLFAEHQTELSLEGPNTQQSKSAWIRMDKDAMEFADDGDGSVIFAWVVTYQYQPPLDNSGKDQASKDLIGDFQQKSVPIQTRTCFMNWKPCMKNFLPTRKNRKKIDQQSLDSIATAITQAVHCFEQSASAAEIHSHATEVLAGIRPEVGGWNEAATQYEHHRATILWQKSLSCPDHNFLPTCESQHQLTPLLPPHYNQIH